MSFARRSATLSHGLYRWSRWLPPGRDQLPRSSRIGRSAAALLAWSVVLSLVGGSLAMLSPLAAPDAAQAATLTALHVSGNQLLDANNQVVRLRGVNRAGTEYACIQGWGIFDGDNTLSDDSQVPLMKNWGINAVNFGLNEDCWLGINGAPTAYAGANYISAIQHEAATLESYGIYPIINLFWTAPGTTQAKDQSAMPDNDHSPALWQSVANTFKNDPRVVFRLKEEPYPAGNTDGAAAWQCWKNGDVQYGASGSLTPVSTTTNCSEGYKAVGMQSLINIIRGTGATNVIQVPGVEYANSMTHFLDSAYRVSDPLSAPQLMGVVDVYPVGNVCGSTSCYNSEYAPVIAQMPFMAGEFGESVDGSVCTTSNVDTLMSWFDQQGAGYAAWTWDTWGGCLQLITSYSSGAPNGNWGNDYKNHLLSLASTAPTATPTLAAMATATPLPPTATATATLPPATATATSVPSTATPVPPTATPAATSAAPTPTATSTSSTLASAPTGLLFGDGFESGSLPGAWTTMRASSGNTLALDSSLEHSGNASLKAVQARKSNGNAYVSKTLSTGRSKVDARGYVYLSNPVNWGQVPIVGFYSGSTFLAWVVYNVDPQSPSLQVYNGANNHWYTCSQTPSLNAWHSLELGYAIGAGTAGSFSLWLDGTPVCSATGIATSSSNTTLINRVVVGPITADGTAGLTVHVDDVAIATGYVGP